MKTSATTMFALLAIATCSASGSAAPGSGAVDEGQMPPSHPMEVAAASSMHQCAVFGGTAGAACDNYPDWTTGTWQPPPGAVSLHVLVVGGGGGGGASIERGIGGNGGNSGEVVNARMRADGSPIKVRIGINGRGGFGFRVPGAIGGVTEFGTILARGGIGGRPAPVAFAPPSNGGGGAGGGYYEPGNHGGAGGAGGTGGSDGEYGSAGTDPDSPVRGTEGGVGNRFPTLAFTQALVTPGRGGAGGAAGSGALGYGGGGGGGGGGILIVGHGAGGVPGASGEPERDAQGGGGGAGYGGGGGGGGNFMIGAVGGEGAAGVVYVEWAAPVTQLQPPARYARRWVPTFVPQQECSSLKNRTRRLFSCAAPTLAGHVS